VGGSGGAGGYQARGVGAITGSYIDTGRRDLFGMETMSSTSSGGRFRLSHEKRQEAGMEVRKIEDGVER